MASVLASTFVLLLVSLPANAATSQRIAACENEDQGECTVENVVDDEIAMLQVKLQTESVDKNRKSADQKDGETRLSNEENRTRAGCYAPAGNGYPDPCGGDYISNSQEYSLEACENRCTANWQCNVFAFETQGWGARTCGLYKSDCHGGRAKTGEYRTYRKATNWYWQQGYGYPSSGYISNSNEFSLSACQQKCSEEPRCKFVAFNTNAGWAGGTCGLYSQDGARTKSYCGHQCGNYCASTGCAWTAKWSCPWAPRGTQGKANEDGTAGYNCCCVKRNQESQQCGGSPAAQESSECYQTFEKICR